MGLPWWSTGWDSVLPLQGERVLIAGGGTRISHATWRGQKKKRMDASMNTKDKE